jgi:hypothetical protein
LEKISKANSLNHSCQAPHTQCVISGRTKVGMDDGMKQQFAPGDVLVVPPRHNAVGNELGCRWVSNSKRLCYKLGLGVEEEIKYYQSPTFSGKGSTSVCFRYSCQHVPWKNFRFSKSVVSMFIPQYLQIRPQLNRSLLFACDFLSSVRWLLSVYESLTVTVG